MTIAVDMGRKATKTNKQNNRYARSIQYISFMNQKKHANRLNYSYFMSPTYEYEYTFTQLLPLEYNDMAIAE